MSIKQLAQLPINETDRQQSQRIASRSAQRSGYKIRHRHRVNVVARIRASAFMGDHF